jgi:quercetin dioxygenase-like cupin family protein
MDKTSLTTLLDEQLKTARTAASGRSAHTVYGGHTRTLRQTLITLLAGQRLDEHESPGEATIQVLAGRVRLTTSDAACEAATGELIEIPDARHALEALDDAAILLTVAMVR